MSDSTKLVAIKKKYERLTKDQSVLEADLTRVGKVVKKKYGVKDVDCARARLKELRGVREKLKGKRDKAHKEVMVMMSKMEE